MRRLAYTSTLIIVFSLAAAGAGAQTSYVKVTSPNAAQPFGKSAAGGGDVDGDGVPEFIVATYKDPKIAPVFSGADGHFLYNVSSAVVDPLGPGGIFTTISVASAGDVDGDGLADWIMGIPEQEDYLGDIYSSVAVVSGAGTFITTFAYQFNAAAGTAVAGPGDLDADGFDDIIFSAGHGASPWKIEVKRGPSGGALYTISGAAGLGNELGPAGDINLDGVPDFIAATPAIVYSGLDGNAIYSVGAAASVAAAGDINSDGFPDFMAGGANINVYSGRSGSLIYTIGASYPGAPSLASLGDVDGDGISDIIAGAPGDATNGANSGAAIVYSGADGALLYTILGAAPGDELGREVASAGDLNGDGRPDALVLSPGKKTLFPQVQGGGYLLVVSFAPGLAQSGTGTPGCLGVHTMNCNAVPKPNTPQFAFTATEAPKNALGLGLIADATVPGGAYPFGLQIVFYVDLPASTEILTFDIVSDGNGFAKGNVPIPNDPLLTGITRGVQTIWLWSGGPCAPSPLGLSSSMLLTVIVQ